ncbi:MAG: MFS transporter [Candidatus Eremiobacteraeota bacterium]|nr:MFS transporter [Candidatus Eremiobacteraeota bacterium]
MNRAGNKWAVLALVTSAQLGASIVQQGIGALGPFLAVTLALDNTRLGTIFGVLTAGSACSTALAGVAVDRYGERRMILFSGATMGVALCLAAAIPSYAWLLACFFIVGIGYAASTPAGGRAILLWFATGRGLAMGIRQMGVPLGGIVGALALPALASAANYRVALVCGGVLTVVPAIATAVLYREPEVEVRAVRSLRAIVRASLEVARDERLVFVTLACMILIFSQAAMLTFYTLTLVRDDGLDPRVAAGALAIAQLGASAGRLGWGYISDRVFGGDRMLPVIVACLGVTLTSIAVARLPAHNVAAAYAVAAVLGFTAAGWNGLFAAAQVEIGGIERAGSALGIGLTGLFGASAVGAPLFGAVAAAFGYAIAWYALGAFVLIAIWPAQMARRAIARANAR